MADKISVRNIFIFREFETEMANFIVQQLIYFDNESNEPIKMYINSGGGEVNALLSILDAMKGIKSPIYTIAVGEAGSAAAVLLSAGDKRFVGENSRVMIHEMFSGTIGKISEIKENVSVLEKRENQIFKIMSENTGKTTEQIKSDVYKFDKYMFAQEAIDYGLADELFTQETKKKFNLSEKMRGLPCAFKLSEFNFGDGTENLSEAMLFKVGDYKGSENFSLTKKDLEQLKTNFNNNVRGIDISIENTHDNDAGEKPAWGWINALYPKKNGDELWAKIKFTDTAKKTLASEQYKYISPEFYHEGYVNEKGESFDNVLIGAALTNRPFQKGEPIKLSERSFQIQELEKMDKESLIKKLSEDHSIDVPALLDNQKKYNDIAKENETLKTELSAKDEKINLKDKEVAFDKLKVDGKVVEAMKEKCFLNFKTSKDMDDFFAQAPALVNMKSKGEDVKLADNGLTESELELHNSDQKKYTVELLKSVREVK